MLTDGFAERLQQLRQARGLSLRELARKVDRSQPAIGNYENGEHFPDIRTLELLADALQVCPCQLAFGLETTKAIRVKATKLEKVRALLEKALQEL